MFNLRKGLNILEYVLFSVSNKFVCKFHQTDFKQIIICLIWLIFFVFSAIILRL